ncbi:MAG: diguanylate cyclase [Bacteroidota bacterium]
MSAQMTIERCLRYIAEITSTLSSSHQAERVLHLVVDRLVRIYQCQTGAVITINPRTEYLQMTNACGISLTFAKQFHRTINMGAVANLIWTGRVVMIHDAATEPEKAEELKLEHPFSSCICIPLTINHRTTGYLHLDSLQSYAFNNNDLLILTTFAQLAAIALDRARLYDEVLRLERIDHESGLEKYSFFIERLQELIERALRFNETMGLIFFDIDNYKDIVNTYGYEQSLKFIKEFGTLIRRSIRPIDLASRFGTDEFIILHPNTPTSVVLDQAEQIRKLVADTTFTDKNIHTTISIGVGIYPHDGSDVQTLMINAKNAVIEAQRSGRNMVYYSRRPTYISTR